MNKEEEIEELKAIIEHLQIELSHREEDLIHANENVFYREMEVEFNEDKIKQQAVREFVEKIIELLEEMKMERSSEYNDGVVDCITNIKSQMYEL